MLFVYRKAFTLIEILIAMALLMVVVVSTLAIFRASATSWRKGEMRTLRYQQARFILERMSKEISSIVPPAAAGPYCLGSADKFCFITALADAPAALSEVGYWLDAGKRELVRAYQSNPDYDFSTFDEEEALSENIASLNFQYSTAESWQEAWDGRPEGAQSGRLPRAVKISFAVQDEQAAHSEPFSIVVTLATAADW